MAKWQTGEQPKKEGRYLVRYSYRTPWTGVVISTENKAERKKDKFGKFYWCLCDYRCHGYVADPAIVAWKELE